VQLRGTPDDLWTCPVSARRTCLAALAVTVGVLAGPASAGVESGPWKRIGKTPAVVPSDAVAPRVLELPTADEAPPAATPAQRDALQRRLESALAGSTAGTLSAAVDVEGYEPVLRRESSHPLPPASTQKSYVGLSALVALGPDARYRTEVATTAPVSAGRVQGHVWLVAGGDPYLTMGYLRLLARSVRAAGITRIDGDVRLDDMRYDQRRTADGWKSSFMPGQSGPLSALAVDGNRWRSDSTFLADPAFPAAVLFRDYLRAEGVSVGDAVRRDPRPAAARTLAVHNGTPLPAAVRRALKTSDNFATELLLKEVGRVVRGDGSSAGGLTAVRDVLGRHAVPVGAGSDGSGLSAHNRQTTAGQVLLLRAADGSGSGASFRESLPLGCRDGTLRKRYCGTAAEGRVSAKTGTLSGVRVLSGYTTTASGRDVWFSFQLTGVKEGAKALAAIDRAVVVLAGSTD
jgi:D-alanyl-D-alanine carboxypeptidase/D-alanyl-D-alanine-endopeptidase (penicillin-binding protein 4)